ncbi:NAD-dependent epimerase/dehydratase family protein [Alkalihalobacillus sp. TS-13]|uniref:NAD-dependent epimerase/dehydratase family protein n=1 Tax=Alkalihalobacillus sp. TS-13 TaxID=2842455 RepID=UPI001C878C8B|nr:NAD-dependent epimerase/dehydratase family protein [Alkalihalobacillus sp. TS-13]
MNILITGVAGFIGSHLCEHFLQKEGIIVTGVDKMTGNYQKEFKERNIQPFLHHPRFRYENIDLAVDDLKQILPKVDVVYHLAGIPGVRTSWGSGFNEYVQNNILATQRLLEACKGLPIKKFVYASTSSIYGEQKGKVSEELKPEPLSPYGISKLTGEYLCKTYHQFWGIPTIILRYFTVYGPRQRPDMAFHIFIKQIMQDKPITIIGDGKQSRDFTFVTDCVEGTASVINCENCVGTTINIGGKENATILEVIDTLEELIGKKAAVTFQPAAKGEPKHTWADISKAGRLLNYQPDVSLKEGLKKEIEDLAQLYKNQ